VRLISHRSVRNKALATNCDVRHRGELYDGDFVIHKAIDFPPWIHGRYSHLRRCESGKTCVVRFAAKREAKADGKLQCGVVLRLDRREFCSIDTRANLRSGEVVRAVLGDP